MIKKVLVSIIAVALIGIFCPQLNSNATESEDSNLLSAGAANFLDVVTEEKIWGYTNLGVANVDNHLNVRALPQTDGKLLGKMSNNAACEIISIEGEWAKIKSGEVEGFVNVDFLYMGGAAKRRAEEVIKLTATVEADALKVREEPNLESPVITQVGNKEELEVVDEEKNGWVGILLDNEKCYVSADYVEVGMKLPTAITMTELLYGEGVSDIRVDISQYAKQFIGNPYVWGGTSLTKGADCSGFVQSVFKNFGIHLSRSSGTQVNNGTKISLSEAKAGDLVFYARGGRIDHVALYLGSGQVVHASSPSTGIKLSNVNYRSPHAVVRVIQD